MASRCNSCRGHHRANNNANLVLPSPGVQVASSIFFFNFLLLNTIYHLHHLGLAAPGQRSLIIVKVVMVIFFFMVICFMGNIPSGAKLLLDLFPPFRGGRAAQILFLEFIKDGLGDNTNLHMVVSPANH